MTHPGHRETPVNVTAPGDLDRATLRNWDPTPAQAQAGNYKKTHAILNGLYVTIETPLDRVRRGTGPDGESWSVRMPAHYGAVKRTEGADGDEIDVYVGPEAHRAHALPVYVIDQVDADSGVFDEHKCCLGFASGRDALRIYEAAFSDGKGRRRVGAVTNMPFDAFRAWLRSDDTAAPLCTALTVKSVSALGCGCVAVHDPCSCQTGGSGDFMTTDTNDAGYLTKALSKILGRMTPTERTDMFKDAAVTAALEIGKAADLLEHPGTHRVEDLSDEPLGEMPEMPHEQGPGSSAAPGKIPVGSPQASSGGGAAAMEREYSRHAPQTGLVRITEELGRKVASHARVMKGFMAFGKAMQDQIAIIQSSTSLTPATPDGAFIDAAIAKALPGAVALALAKAIPEVVRAVSKAKVAAEGEKKEEESEEEEDEDEDDGEEESAKAESEVEREDKEEGEDEDEKDEAKKAMRKAAAVERLIAKSLLRTAKAESEEAEDAMEDGRHAAGKRHHKKAKHRMEKAVLHANVAKSLRGGKVGPSMTAIEKSLGGVAKALKDMKAKNQDKWPSHSKTGEGEAAKAAEAAAKAAEAAAGGGTGAAPNANAEQIAKATASVEKALAGMALLQADVQQVMQMVGGQSRNPGDGGRPPTDALFKAADLTLVGGKEAQVKALAQAGQITMAEHDKAIDALNTMKIPGMPQGMLDATIAACPAPVQAILRKAA